MPQELGDIGGYTSEDGPCVIICEGTMAIHNASHSLVIHDTLKARLVVGPTIVIWMLFLHVSIATVEGTIGGARFQGIG